MTKEEQLKIYSAYLPYGLKIEFTRNIYPGNVEIRTLGLDDLKLFLHQVRPGSFKIKPILYDLSYLTKEIEHEGAVVIMQEILSHLDFEWLIGNPKLASKLNQEDFEILVKHHFNVFSLPEDLFINKATLTNK